MNHGVHFFVKAFYWDYIAPKLVNFPTKKIMENYRILYVVFGKLDSKVIHIFLDSCKEVKKEFEDTKPRVCREASSTHMTLIYCRPWYL